MRLISDFHTHTVFSHGKGTIEDNVKVAIAKGLKTIGISDHGSDHIFFGVKRKDFFQMRNQIEKLKVKYPNIEILLGLEANIINKSGKMAITKEEIAMFDYIMAGYHFGTIGESVGLSLTVHSLNGLGLSSGPNGQKIRAINTELVINTVERNQIKILTHPGCKGEIFVKSVAEVCARRGTLMEINNSHGFLTVDQLKEAAQTEVKFIIGSDAHVPDKVGNFEHGLNKAIEAGIDLSRIVNIAEE